MHTKTAGDPSRSIVTAPITSVLCARAAAECPAGYRARQKFVLNAMAPVRGTPMSDASSFSDVLGRHGEAASGPRCRHPKAGRLQHTIQKMRRRNIGTIHTHTSLPSHRTSAGLVRLEEIAMKTILSALVALSVMAGIAGSANALDAKTFYEQVDRTHYAKKDDWTAWGGAMRGLHN
jgi:hypothetical protein